MYYKFIYIHIYKNKICICISKQFKWGSYYVNVSLCFLIRYY